MLCLFLLFIIANELNAQASEETSTCSLLGCEVPDELCTYCVKCSEEKFTLYDLDNTQLDKASCFKKIDGCSKYNKEGKCSQCSTGLSIVDIDGTQHCSPCSTLTLDKKCNTCENSKFLFLIEGLCIKLPYCLTIDAEGKCIECNSESKLYESKCYLKVPNCKTQIMNDCKVCDTSVSLLNPKTKRCNLKIADCLVHSFTDSKIQCDLCENQYELDIQGNCRFSACLKSDKGICEACADGYLLDDKRVCEKRIKNCIIQENKICHKCNKGFIFYDFKCEPSNCEEFAEDVSASVIQNGSVKRRKDVVNALNRYFRIKSDDESGIEIKKKIDENEYYISPCKKCDKDFNLDKGNGLCWSRVKNANTNLVFPNCKEAYDGVCQKCIEGYEKTGLGLCVPINCMIVNADQNECKTCQPGYYLNKEKICNKCESKESNLEYCSFCGKNMMIKSQYVKGEPLCTPIIQECKTYLKSHRDACEECIFGYEVSIDGKYCFEKSKKNQSNLTCTKMFGNLLVTYKLKNGKCHPIS